MMTEKEKKAQLKRIRKFLKEMKTKAEKQCPYCEKKDNCLGMRRFNSCDLDCGNFNFNFNL
jgi:hypothetical protein